MTGHPLRPATRRSHGEPLPHHQADRPRAHPWPKNFPQPHMRAIVISGINHRFRWLSQSEGQITHVLLTRSPLEYPRKGLSARLACVKHAASVRPEPGSNSPSKNKHPTPTTPKGTTSTRKREPHPLTKNKPQQKCQNSLPKKPSTPKQPTTQKQMTNHPDANGAKQTNSSTIKHTVEFSKIRRTRSSSAEADSVAGQPAKTYRALGEASNATPGASGVATRFPLQLTFWPGGGATCCDTMNCRPFPTGVPNRGPACGKHAGQRGAGGRRTAAGR